MGLLSAFPPRVHLSDAGNYSEYEYESESQKRGYLDLHVQG